MQTKICAKCGKYKDATEFYLQKNGKLSSWCLGCRKQGKKEWDQNNKEYRKQYRMDNKDHIKEKNDEYRRKNKDKIIQQTRINNERLKEKRKKDRERTSYKEKRKIYEKEWRANNKERTSVYMKEYYNKDESKKIGRSLRNRLRRVLKGEMKAIRSQNIAGCSLQFLKEHIESLFQENMSWSNYGKWHLDHYLPCRAFNLKLPIHQRACFFWLNLRPMWGADNISKNDNYHQEEFDAYMEWFIEKQY